MVVARISKTFSFDAAHQLPNHRGKCARPHGHTYHLELVVEGEVITAPNASDEGMVVDYDQLTNLWEASLKPLLDHQDLNDTLGSLGCWPTTAENIAGWVLRRCQQAGFPGQVKLVEVGVSETPKTWARVRA